MCSHGFFNLEFLQKILQPLFQVMPPLKLIKMTSSEEILLKKYKHPRNSCRISPRISLSYYRFNNLSRESFKGAEAISEILAEGFSDRSSYCIPQEVLSEITLGLGLESNIFSLGFSPTTKSLTIGEFKNNLIT